MIDTPEIIQTGERRTAVIRLTIPRSEIMKAMGPARAEVAAVLAAQGIKPAGPWFSHHFRTDPATFDFEVGVPVATDVAPSGRVTASSLPAVRAARTVFRGSYEHLGAAWGEFNAWVKSAGHKPQPGLWEAYVSGPESGPNPAAWQTELTRPLLA